MFRSSLLLIVALCCVHRSRSFAIKRRPGILQRTSLSPRWSSTRRTCNYRHRRSFTTEDVLHGRRERRVI